jgi:hypothetical protein
LSFQTYKGNIIDSYIDSDSITISDGYQYGRKERLEFLSVIIHCYDFKRSAQSLEGEWALHNVLYYLDVDVEETKNVTLDFDCDPRWYVRVGTIVCQMMGI